MMVSLYASVVFGTVANVSQWTSFAVFCLIVRELLQVTRFGFSNAFMRFLHFLTHRTNIVVFLLVVVQVFFAESLVFRLIMGVLFFVEGIVFYEGSNLVLFQ